MTSKRVSINLVIETDADPADVHLSVLASIPDRYAPVHSSVNGFDLDDPDEDCIQLVIDLVGGLLAALVDRPDLADEKAKAIGAVIVELPISVDYRLASP